MLSFDKINLFKKYNIPLDLMSPNENSIYRLSIQNMQVAEDYYDYKLQAKAFKILLDYSCKMYVTNVTNLQKAQRHYRRRMLVHYFYLWITLPAVLHLERAKEEKKRKWREKVWEIVPDYKVPSD
ncbi:coiled-coil domain-containing protein 191 isoform X3 [Agrilus planipennis]|uniref:Coiled-coil domain-containing protein 191 isoform X3 n=1 Tax=Agrilus planipennis TaxID=224129 RepID=A0A1W4XTA6_AGRPL|nr:coiled-coil domain-containing protein 191 isoform X3 [Agrilus planipennis]